MDLALVALLLLVAYVHAGYPLVLLWLGRRGSPRAVSPECLPTVTVFLAAYNEAKGIARKIENSLALDYPAGRLDVVVASDGSTDGTADVARRYADQGVVVFESARRGGKNAAINQYLPETRGEIVVFTDANAFFDAGAIRALVRNFADERVGLVVGDLRYVDERNAVGRGEGFYFRYEALLKRLESRLGTVVAANGSIYALRRDLFRPLDLDVPNDFAHPIQVAAAGRYVVFEPAARATERATSSLPEEFRRRSRIVTRGFTAFARYRAPYRMLSGTWGFCFASHKLLRWFVWGYLAVILALSTARYGASPLHAALVQAQLLFYLLALLGWLGPARLPRALAVPFYFCAINAAALVGLLRYVRGRRQATWETAATTR
jgi:biofilm PGA synthesis N-glycosyltransferase PgaC